MYVTQDGRVRVLCDRIPKVVVNAGMSFDICLTARIGILVALVLSVDMACLRCVPVSDVEPVGRWTDKGMDIIGMWFGMTNRVRFRVCVCGERC